jgi:ABC-type amino acid transport substrate-binding protein
MAGVTCAGLLSFVFIGENISDLGALLENPVLPALALGGALVALLIGSLLLSRRGPDVVRWSSLAGVAWLIGFGPLVVRAIVAALGGYEFGPVLSSSLITGLGIAGAVVAYWSQMAERRLK